MAISKIKPRHASEGRSIAAVLADRIDYDKNPEKTNGGLLVIGYQCSPVTREENSFCTVAVIWKDSYNFKRKNELVEKLTFASYNKID